MTDRLLIDTYIKAYKERNGLTCDNEVAGIEAVAQLTREQTLKAVGEWLNGDCDCPRWKDMNLKMYECKGIGITKRYDCWKCRLSLRTWLKVGRMPEEEK